ncbi:MAG: PIN domain-containing protein [Halobacteriales archaeon]|nr:PIN domain-containing protein [Halobacteriales archaeon]
MILDTSFFIDLIDGDEGAIDMARRLEDNGIPQRIPAQVVYELFVGVGYTDTPDEEVGTLEGVLAARPVVETTEAIAARAGRMDGRLRRDGVRIAVSDLIIGATGLAYDEPVVTRDVEDFERIPGVDVATY